MKKINLGFEEQILLNDLLLTYETREAIEKFILEDLIRLKNENDEEVEIKEMLVSNYTGILEFFEEENITTKDLKNMEFEFKNEDFEIPKDFYLDDEEVEEV